MRIEEDDPAAAYAPPSIEAKLAEKPVAAEKAEKAEKTEAAEEAPKALKKAKKSKAPKAEKPEKAKIKKAVKKAVKKAAKAAKKADKKKARKKLTSADKPEGAAICISLATPTYEKLEKVRAKMKKPNGKKLSRSSAIDQALQLWFKKAK